MLDYLSDMTRRMQPQLSDAMLSRIGGSIKAQQRFLERIESVRSPAVIEITSSFGKRCKSLAIIALTVDLVKLDRSRERFDEGLRGFLVWLAAVWE